MRFKHKGFTIIELLVVIAVVGILASITTVAYSGSQKKALNATRTSEVDQWRAVLKSYANFYGTYPPQLDAAESIYCLGDNFKDINSNGVGDCRDVGPNLRVGDPVHIEVVSAGLVTELKRVSSTLPSSQRTLVNNAYLGPYIYRWTNGQIWIYNFFDSTTCPVESVDAWAAAPAGVKLCRWRVA